MIRLKCALSLCASIVCVTPSHVHARTGTVLLMRSAWFWSSAPTADTGDLIPPIVSVSEHCRLEWYNPLGVKNRDLNPILTDAEGGDTEHQVLELGMKPPDATFISPSKWTGLTQSLSRVGDDYTRFAYLQIWVNDFTPYPDHVNTHGTLHIDLGRVSEDAFWSPDTIPNGQLDTEDKNGDGSLDRSNDLAWDEDTGLDGLHSVNEPGYSQDNRDPNRDDYYFDPEQTPLDYSGINNLERNGGGDPAARPDTEDLNADGFADFHNAYFQATLDLADTSLAARDIVRDYGPLESQLEYPIRADNGWRLYILPLSDEVFRRVGPAASWENIHHIRVWLDGANAPLRIQIGGIEFLDSQYRPTPPAAVVFPNAPNPFNPGTTIRFELPDPGRVRLRIYDVRGRLVRQLLDADHPAGYHSVVWNGEDGSGRRVASGAYWYRVELPGISPQVRKMVLAR